MPGVGFHACRDAAFGFESLLASGIGRLSGDAAAAPASIVSATRVVSEIPVILVRTIFALPMVYTLAGAHGRSLCNV